MAKTLNEISTELETYIHEHCRCTRSELYGDGRTPERSQGHRFNPADLRTITKIASQATTEP